MTSPTEGDRRILVIANRTCPCPTLADEVARRANAAPTDVLVVAPALNSRLRHWLSDVDEALTRAHERLELAITALAGAASSRAARSEMPIRCWRSKTRSSASRPTRS